MHNEDASDTTSILTASPVEPDLEAIGQSRRHYQNLLNAVNGIVWEADASTMRFTFVSERAEELVGYPARRWVEEPNFWVEHLHPDDRDWAMQFCIDAAAERRDHDLEYRMITREGRTIWLRETVAVVTDDEGSARLRGVMVDITRQKAIEQELQRRDAILEAVRFAGEQFLIPATSWDESVNRVLERLGRAAGMSRVYIFENYVGPDGETWATNTHEWVMSPELSVIDLPQLQAMSYGDIGFGRWVHLFEMGEIVYGCVKDFPEAERPEMEAEGTLSIVLVPIFVGGEWWGFIGFDDCEREREPSKPERDALKAAADMLGAAMGRERELARRDAVLEAVRRVGEVFLSRNSSWEAAVDQALECLGRGTEASRVVLFENYNDADGELMGTRKHLWVHPNYSGRQPTTARTTFSYRDLGLERWVAAGHRAEILHGPVSDAPAQERGSSRSDTLAYAVVPIFVDGTWWGFIRFDECVRKREFSAMERDAMKAAADTLGTAIGRMRAEETTARLAAIVESSEDAIVGESLDALITSWNAGAERLFGYRADEAIGQPVTLLLPPGQAPRLAEALAAASRNEPIDHYETKRVKQDGSLVDVSIAISPIRGVDGLVVGAAAIMRDITRQKEAERKLRESQRALQTLLSNLPGMAYRSIPGDPWRVEFVSEGALDLTGYQPSMLACNPDASFLDIIHAEDRGVLRHDIEAAIIARQPYHLTYRIITASGSEKWVMEQGRPVYGAPGDAVALEGIITDITDRVEASHELERRVEERTRELGTLLSVSASVASTLELQPLLHVVLDQLGQVVDHSAAAIFALEGDDTLRLLDYRGPTDYSELDWAWRLSETSHSRAVIENRAPVIIPDVHADTPMATAFRRKAISDLGSVPDYIASWMGVPLMLRDKAIGLLAVDSAEPNAYTMRHARLALAFASQAAVAIENARLYEEAQGTAALHERQRLARELHDSVSQALFGIGLGARTARTLVEQDPEKAVAPIDYVLSLAEAGLAEMRALIFELRPEALEEEGLVAALKKQGAALRARYGIEVAMALPESIELAQSAQEAIYRIAQEGLNNIVKHARASRVSVIVASETNGVSLKIIDDGIGFDTSGSFPGHLGLKTMRERAEKLGGSFRLVSAPGEGCRIEVVIPVAG